MMIISQAEKSDIKSIKQLWDENFDEDSIEWRKWYFDTVFKIENVLVGKVNSMLASMLHMNNYIVNMRGANLKSFAMAGVATKNEHRKKGYAAELINHSLKKAYNSGFDFSFLYPFDYEFYEKYGYKLGYYKYKYKAHNISGDKHDTIKIVDCFKEDTFNKIYKQFTKNLNGYAARDSIYYTSHIKELLCDNKVVCFKIKDQKGYFSIDNEQAVIDELVYEGEILDAMKSISGYYQKELSFENLFDLQGLNGIKEKHCMGRVINVQSVFEKMIYKDIDIKIKITDNTIEENNGVWHIVSKSGNSKVGKVEEKEDYSLDVSMLTPILTGIDTEENSEAQLIQKMLFLPTQAFIFEVC